MVSAAVLAKKCGLRTSTQITRYIEKKKIPYIVKYNHKYVDKAFASKIIEDVRKTL